MIGRGASPQLAVGLDIDGTISSDPVFFASLTDCLREKGITVHIVSSRSRCAREETKAELRKWRIDFDALFLLPSFSDASRLCPHNELDWYEMHCWCKVDYVNAQGLRFFVDDDPVVLRLFKLYGNTVSAIHPDYQQLIVSTILGTDE